MNKRAFIVLIILFLTIQGLTIWRYIELDKLDRLGVDYAALITELGKTRKENNLMRQQILAASALTHIYDEAKQLGFKDGVTLILK